MAVDDPLVAVELRARDQLGRVRAARVGLGHREAGADLAVEQRLQPALLLLLGAVLGEDLHVAGVGGGAVEDGRRDAAATHQLAEHPVLPVGQAGAEALVGEEQVPEPLGPGALAQLDHDLGVRDARAHLVVERLHRLALDGIDVLLHELANPVEEGCDAIRRCEIHERQATLPRPHAEAAHEKRDRIAYLTINRPDAKNAIDPETHELLWAAWEDFRDDDSVDVAILTGAGDAFCAGADLKTYIPPIIQESTPRWVRDNVATGLGGLTRGLHRITKPTIAAVNGWALAGGLELALACDIRVASERAHVRLVRGAPRLSPRRRRDRAAGQHLRRRRRAGDAADRRADRRRAGAALQPRLARGRARRAARRRRAGRPVRSCATRRWRCARRRRRSST